MYCLAIDTTSKFLCVALIKDKQVLGQYNKVHDRQHGVLLLSKIEKVLSSCGLSVEDVDCLAVDVGPGSFTGLRIGIATAKGLSLALDKPIIGLCSLDLIAVQQEDSEAIICPIIDAKRQQVYSAIYQNTQGGVKRKGKYFLGKIDELLKGSKQKMIFCGDAIDLYKEQIAEKFSDSAIFAPRRLWYPKAFSFSKLCLKRYNSKKFQKTEQVAPLYLYQSTCAVRKNRV